MGTSEEKRSEYTWETRNPEQRSPEVGKKAFTFMARIVKASY